jgi:hypothetical protein
MTKSELKQLIKEVISDSLKNESLLKYSTNPKEVLANIIEIAEDDNMDDFNKVINMRALAKGYFDKVGYKVTNENYEDRIKDAKDRLAYLALRKQEKDYISKSKQSSSPIKKQHYMDMSKQVLDKALDILKKHKVVDEANTKELQKLGFTPTKSDVNEVKGYVFGPMETPNNWISTNAKPKMKNGVKKWVVSAADFQKAFPNIQMKQLPTNPSQYSDYYVVDNEGDLISYSQANIGSGLD